MLLKQVDYAIGSKDFPERVTGDGDLLRSLPEMARRFGCRVTGATLGHEGVLAWDGSRFHYCPGFVVEAVDTTGAGDVFHAGLAYGLLQRSSGRAPGQSSGQSSGQPLPFEKILEFSCAAAALNCTGLGARGGIRPIEEITRLIREGKRGVSAYTEDELAAATRAATESIHEDPSARPYRSEDKRARS